jgi:hypothetical protein
MGTKESIALSAFISWQWLAHIPVHAWEWKGKCGITKSTISTCTFIKGDGALPGEIRDHIDDMIKQETFIQLI